MAVVQLESPCSKHRAESFTVDQALVPAFSNKRIILFHYPGKRIPVAEAMRNSLATIVQAIQFHSQPFHLQRSTKVAWSKDAQHIVTHCSTQQSYNAKNDTK